MVPAAVVVIDALPLTVNGKLDTRALPAPEYSDRDRYQAPNNPTEEILAGIYTQVLGIQQVGINDSFFDLGGDSISAMRLISATNASFDTNLAVRTVFEAPSVRTLSQRLGEQTSSVEVAPVEVFQDGAGIPLCCIHDGFGLGWSYRALGDYLDCPIIAIQQVQQDGEPDAGSIREIARIYADRLQAFYPTGPYNILGWSFGGVVAHELAIELHRRGCKVERLVLLDAILMSNGSASKYRALDESQILENIVRINGIPVPVDSEPLTYRRAEELMQQRQATLPLPPKQLVDTMVRSVNANQSHLVEHVPDVFDGDVIIFSAAQTAGDHDSSLLRSWRPYVAGDITEHSVDCAHHEMLNAESLDEYGKQLRLLLET
jgi:thioesterase domain-containing protein/acyl carrier protein